MWWVSWNITTAGPSKHMGKFNWLRSIAAFSSGEKCFKYAFDASPRKLNMSECNLSAFVRYMITSDIASTFMSSLLRWFELLDVLSSPSVSTTNRWFFTSYAAQMPTVHEVWDAEVENTSWPLKNVWFRVYDLPSPVLPKMETTFKVSLSGQASFLPNSSLFSTY